MSDLPKSLKTAIFNTMERMFFLLPDPDGEDAVISTGYSVFIGVTGKPRHRLILVFERELAIVMAVNTLGKPLSDVSMLNKCLLEAANVIAGNLLHVWDESGDRNITLPTLDRDSVFPVFTPRETLVARFMFEGLGMEVRVETGDEG